MSARPELIAIAAIAESNRAIGYGGRLPWTLAADLQRFRRLTMGHAVIVGRKTWEGDLKGKPLDGRTNIVVSRSLPNGEWDADGRSPIIVARSLTEAIQCVPLHQLGFVIGGASLYQQGLSLVDRLEITLVQGNYKGDTFFPDYCSLVAAHFTLTHLEQHNGYRFETYEKPQPS